MSLGGGFHAVVVGIAGGSGAGKSAVASRLVELLSPIGCAIVRHDSYYRDLGHMPLAARKAVNVDHPESLETELFVRHLRELMRGRRVTVPRYDYTTQTRETEGSLVEPAPVVIVEGLFVLEDERVRGLCDVKVYVDVPELERLRRRVARDRAERGRERHEVEAHHAERVEPMHREFVEPSRRFADLLVTDGAENVGAMERLTNLIKAGLERPSLPS